MECRELNWKIFETDLIHNKIKVGWTSTIDKVDYCEKDSEDRFANIVQIWIIRFTHPILHIEIHVTSTSWTCNLSSNISSYLLKCIHFPASWETRLRWRRTLESLRPGQSSGLLYEIKRNYFLFNSERICYGLCYHNKRKYIWNYEDSSIIINQNFTVVTDPLATSFWVFWSVS